jgi:hypothetical protein
MIERISEILRESVKGFTISSMPLMKNEIKDQ